MRSKMELPALDRLGGHKNGCNRVDLDYWAARRANNAAAEARKKSPRLLIGTVPGDRVINAKLQTRPEAHCRKDRQQDAPNSCEKRADAEQQEGGQASRVSSATPGEDRSGSHVSSLYRLADRKRVDARRRHSELAMMFYRSRAIYFVCLLSRRKGSEINLPAIYANIGSVASAAPVYAGTL